MAAVPWGAVGEANLQQAVGDGGAAVTYMSQAASPRSPATPLPHASTPTPPASHGDSSAFSVDKGLVQYRSLTDIYANTKEVEIPEDPLLLGAEETTSYIEAVGDMS